MNDIPSIPPGTSNIMIELWERAAPSLSRESLEWFAGATELAGSAAENLQCVAEGIGCLVGSDTQEGGRVQVGSFLSNDSAAALLFAIADGLDNIRALSNIGASANHRLRRPELYPWLHHQ